MVDYTLPTRGQQDWDDEIAAAFAALSDGIDDQGLPSGGVEGQIPVKVSSTAYDVEWGSTNILDCGDVNVPGSIDDGAVPTWVASSQRFDLLVPSTVGEVQDDLADHIADGHIYMMRGVILEDGVPTPDGLPEDCLVIHLEPLSFGYSAYVGSASATDKTTCSIVVGSSIPANTLVVVGVVTGSSDVTATISDSSSNTWTASTTRVYQSTTVTSQIFHSRLSTQIDSGDSITLTTSAETGNLLMAALTISGSATSPLDRSAVSGQSSTLAPSVGPTTTLSSSPQVAVACFGYNPTGRSITFDTAWSKVGEKVTSNRYLALLTKTVSTTAAVSCSGTITGSTAVTAFTLATYKSS